MSKWYFRFWRGHCRRDTMVFAADRWSTRDAPSLRSQDRCRLEYAQMWLSASARAAARPAPSMSSIAFPVDAAARTNSRYPCVSSAMFRPRPAGEPARRAGTGGRALRSRPAARGGSGRPVSSRSAGRSVFPLGQGRTPRTQTARLPRGPPQAGQAAHQGVEDRLVVAGVHAPGRLGASRASVW